MEAARSKSKATGMSRAEHVVCNHHLLWSIHWKIPYITPKRPIRRFEEYCIFTKNDPLAQLIRMNGSMRVRACVRTRGNTSGIKQKKNKSHKIIQNEVKFNKKLFDLSLILPFSSFRSHSKQRQCRSVPEC